MCRVVVVLGYGILDGLCRSLLDLRFLLIHWSLGLWVESEVAAKESGELIVHLHVVLDGDHCEGAINPKLVL